MTIKANYSHRKHVIKSIERNCTCANPADELGLTKKGMEKCSPEHIHIRCKDTEDNMNSWFNGFVENEDGKVRSIWSPTDEIIIISIPKNLQLELF
ncbi:hypothetical protein [Kaistella haifensis]|nr:hypothetical protein [Kaistella haifensis]